MGRKNWKEQISKKGPGKKARKQKDPQLPRKLQEDTVERVKTGTRVKQRGKKRELKTALAKSLPPGKKTSLKKKVKFPSEVKESKEKESASSLKKDSLKKKAKSSSESDDEATSSLKINLFHEASDGASDDLQEMNDSSNGEIHCRKFLSCILPIQTLLPDNRCARGRSNKRAI